MSSFHSSAHTILDIAIFSTPLEQLQYLTLEIHQLFAPHLQVGILRSNKGQRLYSTDVYVTTLCSSPDGHGILSGHVDGSIYRFTFEEGGAGPSHAKLAHHTCIPTALAWGESIVAAGNDGKVIFYDVEGVVLQLFDYTSEPTLKEFTCAAFNPSGESAVIASFNRLHVFNLNVRRNLWSVSPASSSLSN